MATEIEYTLAKTDTELHDILRLQNQNLATNISSEESSKEGFVTVHHTFDVLKSMNTLAPHVIAKDQDRVVGYALAMSPKLRNDIIVLKPMFALIDQEIKNDSTYLIMGQVCVDKAYRRQGIFKALYYKMQQCYHKKYAFLITEIAYNNLPSIHAHRAIGFETLTTHQDASTTWQIVRWNW